MYIILGFLISGILVGLLFQNRLKLKKIIDRLVIFSIFLLLFFLGMEVGSNDEIINNLPIIGLKSISITVFALLGSTLSAFLLFKFIFKRVADED